MERTVVTVTALKAPWPEGVVIGSKVGFAGQPPAWALGKFAPAPEGAKADFDYEPADLVGEGTGHARPDLKAINAQIDDLSEELWTALDNVSALKVERDGLADKLAVAEAANATLTSEKDGALAAAAEARDKLAAAEAAAVDAAANAGNTTKKQR